MVLHERHHANGKSGTRLMADVQLQNVVKRYGNYEAVRGISLEIPDTKFVDSGMSSPASGEKA